MNARVTSRNNPRLKEAARLVASARDRRKAGKCVIEGDHLVAAYAERHGAPETIVVAEPYLARAGIDGLARRFDDRTLVVPEALFEELAVLPSGVGILAVVQTPRPAPSEEVQSCGRGRAIYIGRRSRLDFLAILQRLPQPHPHLLNQIVDVFSRQAMPKPHPAHPVGKPGKDGFKCPGLRICGGSHKSEGMPSALLRNVVSE